MSNKIAEKFIIDILNSGFKRAAKSFSQLIGKKVSITNTQPVILVKHGEDDSPLAEKEEGDLIVLTTQLMGEITGKSFLILSDAESQEIFKTLGLKLSEELKEGFLLEIDNIISATVIADICNELGVEVYGDVPHLFHVHASELDEFMKSKVSEADMASIVFSNTTFHFDVGDDIHPQFIWRFSNEIFNIIPADKLKAIQ
jgi:chemotaxis protein CheY-P-specific phosphatase CheC